MAFHPLGWRPLAFSEIEPFPRAVLQYHYPDVPLHGDFTALKDESWIGEADMLCGGTPCQAFSIAGERKSLSDDRGNLSLQFILLANAIDDLRCANGAGPAWVLWENVPGVLNTPDNAFGHFLGGLAGCDTPIKPPKGGGHPDAGVVDGPARCVAWRVLDARYFGLPQGRKRVFVLARGGAGRWAAPDALLPIAPASEANEGAGKKTWKGIAGHTGRGVKEVVDAMIRGHIPPVVYPFNQITSPECRSNPAPGGPSPTLTTTGRLLMVGEQVRYLTPVEYERLQGYPDGYTDIPWRGKEHAPDGPRYKALGNSWAVPVAAWIGRQIDQVERK